MTTGMEMYGKILEYCDANMEKAGVPDTGS